MISRFGHLSCTVEVMIFVSQSVSSSSISLFYSFMSLLLLALFFALFLSDSCTTWESCLSRNIWLKNDTEELDDSSLISLFFVPPHELFLVDPSSRVLCLLSWFNSCPIVSLILCFSIDFEVSINDILFSQLGCRFRLWVSRMLVRTWLHWIHTDYVVISWTDNTYYEFGASIPRQFVFGMSLSRWRYVWRAYCSLCTILVRVFSRRESCRHGKYCFRFSLNLRLSSKGGRSWERRIKRRRYFISSVSKNGHMNLRDIEAITVNR